jgi:hypothetical protein
MNLGLRMRVTNADSEWFCYGAACGVRRVSGYLSTLTLIPQGFGFVVAVCKSVSNGKP